MSSNHPVLFLHVRVHIQDRVVQGGAPLAHSQNRRLLEDIARLFIGHVAYDLPVVPVPRPHVWIPVPAPAYLLLLNAAVTLLVLLRDGQARLILRDVFGADLVMFHQSDIYLSVVSAEVTSDWD